MAWLHQSSAGEAGYVVLPLVLLQILVEEKAECWRLRGGVDSGRPKLWTLFSIVAHLECPGMHDLRCFFVVCLVELLYAVHCFFLTTIKQRSSGV